MEQIPETPKLDLEGKTLEQQAKVVKAVGDKLVPEILHNYFSAMEYAIKEDAMLRPMMDEMRNPSDELKGFLEKIPSNLASAVDHGFIPPVMREDRMLFQSLRRIWSRKSVKSMTRNLARYAA